MASHGVRGHPKLETSQNKMPQTHKAEGTASKGEEMVEFNFTQSVRKEIEWEV